MNTLLALAVTIFVALSFALGVSILVAVVLRRQAPLRLARQRAIATLCAGRGLVPGAVPGDFAMLGRVAPEWLTNSYSSADHQVSVADLIQPAGKSWAYFSVLAFTVAGVNLPYVAVTRRSLSTMLIGGPPAVELESIDFDQRFTVRARDRRSAVMLLDPGMMQLLLDCELVNFDMVGDRVLAYVNRTAEPAHQPADPAEYVQLFKFFDGFAARVPPLLLTEYGAAS